MKTSAGIEVKMALTWPGSAVVVAPPRVLGVATRDRLPLVALDGRVADLDGHLADEVLPALLDEVHDGGGLVGRGERGEDGDAVAQREPSEVPRPHEEREG